MPTYTAPVRDMQFLLHDMLQIEKHSNLPGFAEATEDVINAILEEGAKVAEEVLQPLNVVGDQEGCTLKDGEVTTPTGFKDAYNTFVEGGWSALSADPEYGGQGLPHVLNSGILEIMSSANMAFGMYPGLSHGAYSAIHAHGTDEQKRTYLPKLVSGEWTGTMNLTEPQAGTDLAAVRTKAEPKDDHYLITGQKIFITWGDHNMTENIVHLVLARLPDAPSGVKGISLFLVPKFLLEDDGTLGDQNDVHVVSLEHKLGIHASPTCVMSYGDNGGAVGYLIGEENNGLACMFTMMNHARLTVGLQGVGIAERALQQAASYANERIQGPVTGHADTAPIIHHPDVRRMLMVMKSLTEASRALAYAAVASFDFVHATEDKETKQYHQARVDLLTPVVKGWCTEIAQEVTSLGIQVHGGMGYVEETGAAQHFRDARILPIYEGTNGIQALDLIGRKFLRDNGAAMSILIEEMKDLINDLNAHSELSKVTPEYERSIDLLEQANQWILANNDKENIESGSVAFNFLMLVGTVSAGWLIVREALAAISELEADPANADFYSAKVSTTRFYFQHVAPRSEAYLKTILAGSESIMALDTHQFFL